MQTNNHTKSKKMKKSTSASCNDNGINNDKSAKKPKHLGDFGFTYVENIRGKKFTHPIVEGVINQNLRCNGCRKSDF